jgi:hypothetical protein
MRVYVLHFKDRNALSRAFDRLYSTEEVASCLIEPERCRIRFTAPAVRAEPLVERFYLEGGLTWCSGHALGPPPGQAVSPR